MIYLNIELAISLYVTKEEFNDCGWKDHIIDSIKLTGDRHPEDPLFKAFKRVTIRKWTRQPTLRKEKETL